MIAGFAVFHGHAHGIETVGGSAFAFMSGFLITSGLVAGAGALFGTLASRPGLALAPRLAGGAVALSGLALAVLS